MVVGFTLTKLDGNPYYSPSFPRGGLAATFVADCTNIYSTPTVTITVEHRDEHDTTWTSAGTFPNIDAVGVQQKDLTGLKQIIRFAYDFAAEDSESDAVHIVMQAPTWRPYP